MIAKNQKNTFGKEVWLALIIIGNCLIGLLHLPVDPQFSTLHVLGYEYHHDFVNNRAFVWFTICHLQILVYTMLCFYFSKRRVKWALSFLMYWMVYTLVWDIFQWANGNTVLMTQSLSILLTIILIGVLVSRKIKREGSKDHIFKFKKYKSDVFIAILIIFLPYLEKSIFHLPFDLRELHILGLTISSSGFPNISSFLGYLLLKVYLLLPTLLCFFEVKKWWRYALLIPILLAIFQIRTALNPDTEDLDTYEVIQALPLLLSVLFLLLFLSRTAYYQSRMMRLYQTTYHNLEVLVHKRLQNREAFLKTTKEKWQQLKTTSSDEQELLDLKQHLERELKKQGR